MPSSPASLEHGKRLFEARCAPCHGPEGHGGGPVSKFFPPAPDLAYVKVRERTDGFIWGTVSYGGKAMPPQRRGARPGGPVGPRELGARDPAHEPGRDRPAAASSGAGRDAMTLLERSAAGIGPTAARLAAGAVAVGAVALAPRPRAAAGPPPACAALVASWLFFAGLAAGSVALAAAVRIAYGTWARPLLPIAEATSAFFVPALVLLRARRRRAPRPCRRAASGPAAARLLVSAALVFALGSRFVAAARAPGADPSRVRGAALAYVLAYVVGLSVWAYDLVLRLSAGPLFTVIPPYYFLGAFLSGLAWVALVAAVRDVSGPDLRHDVGKLLFAFIVVWSYLLWALFLPTWYGNVPEEVAILQRRWVGAWKPATSAVLVAVFAWPFWLLFSERMKRRRGTLATGAAAVLVGLWGERFLLVLPSLELEGGAASVLVGAGVAVGVAGVFLLAVGARMGAGPAGAAAPAGSPRAT